MLRTHMVRRVSMLLGAAAASGVVAVGVLTAAPVGVSAHHVVITSDANGIGRAVPAANGIGSVTRSANGIQHRTSHLRDANGI